MGAPKVTREDFIERSRKKHKDKYGYEEVVWEGTQQKVQIKCPVHGLFQQTAAAHLLGKGCKRCACEATNAKLRPSLKDIKQTLKRLHPKLKFPEPHNVYTRHIDFICPVHGSGKMMLGNLLNGSGCKKCSDALRGKEQALTLKEFIERAKAKHGDKYEYSEVSYSNAHTEVTIKCPVHGKFKRTGNTHLSIKTDGGCPACARKAKAHTAGKKTFTVLSNAEANALDWIFKNTSIEPNQILDRSQARLPIITGDFEGMKRYMPDFLVPKKNLIIEVKTPESFGVGSGFYEKNLVLIRRMQKRALAVLEQGYSFQLYLMASTKRIRLPKDWLQQDPRDLRFSFDQTRQAFCK